MFISNNKCMETTIIISIVFITLLILQVLKDRKDYFDSIKKR
jgi:hypothetical protein